MIILKIFCSQFRLGWQKLLTMYTRVNLVRFDEIYIIQLMRAAVI